MRIIEIVALTNGAHNNQTSSKDIPIPEGWAFIPDEMECENFPFGEVTAEEVTYYRDVEVMKDVTKTREVPAVDNEGNIIFDEFGNPVMTTEEYTEQEMVIEQEPYTMMTVTKWIPCEIPEPDPEPEVPEINDVSWDAMAEAIKEGVNEV